MKVKVIEFELGMLILADVPLGHWITNYYYELQILTTMKSL